MSLKVTIGEKILLVGFAGLGVDYLYHDSEFVSKLLIKQKFQSKYENFKPLQFQDNVRRLEKDMMIGGLFGQRDASVMSTVVVGPQGCGKTASLNQFANDQKLKGRNVMVIDLVDADKFPDDPFKYLVDNIYSSLGVPSRASYVRYVFNWLKTFTGSYDDIAASIDRQRIFDKLSLLYKVSDELYQTAKSQKKSSSEGEKGDSGTEDSDKVMIIYDHIDELIKNAGIKTAGGLSLFSTIAWLSTENKAAVHTIIAGNNNVQLFDLVQKSTFNTIQSKIIDFFDPKPDEVTKELQKIGYSDEEIKRILTICGTRLSDLHFFFIQKRLPDDIKFELERKVAQTKLLLTRIIERQNKTKADKLEIVKLLNTMSDKDYSRPTSFKSLTVYYEKMNHKFFELNSFNDVFYATPSYMKIGTFCGAGMFKLASPIVKHVWETEKKNILAECHFTDKVEKKKVALPMTFAAKPPRSWYYYFGSFVGIKEPKEYELRWDEVYKV